MKLNIHTKVIVFFTIFVMLMNVLIPFVAANNDNDNDDAEEFRSKLEIQVEVGSDRIEIQAESEDKTTTDGITSTKTTKASKFELRADIENEFRVEVRRRSKTETETDTTTTSTTSLFSSFVTMFWRSDSDDSNDSNNDNVFENEDSASTSVDERSRLSFRLKRLICWSDDNLNNIYDADGSDTITRSQILDSFDDYICLDSERLPGDTNEDDFDDELDFDYSYESETNVEGDRIKEKTEELEQSTTPVRILSCKTSSNGSFDIGQFSLRVKYALGETRLKRGWLKPNAFKFDWGLPNGASCPNPDDFLGLEFDVRGKEHQRVEGSENTAEGINEAIEESIVTSTTSPETPFFTFEKLWFPISNSTNNGTTTPSPFDVTMTKMDETPENSEEDDDSDFESETTARFVIYTTVSANSLGAFVHDPSIGFGAPSALASLNVGLLAALISSIVIGATIIGGIFFVLVFKKKNQQSKSINDYNGDNDTLNTKT